MAALVWEGVLLTIKGFFYVVVLIPPHHCLSTDKDKTKHPICEEWRDIQGRKLKVMEYKLSKKKGVNCVIHFIQDLKRKLQRQQGSR